MFKTRTIKLVAFEMILAVFNTSWFSVYYLLFKNILLCVKVSSLNFNKIVDI